MNAQQNDSLKVIGITSCRCHVRTNIIVKLEFERLGDVILFAVIKWLIL